MDNWAKSFMAVAITLIGALLFLTIMPLFISVINYSNEQTLISQLERYGYDAWVTEAGDMIFTGDLLPNVDDTYDLGSDATQWKDLYISGDINGATGRGATFVVAASNASASFLSQADYFCDGTADNVQIESAIDALDAGNGGLVVLSDGIFSFSSTVSWDGSVAIIVEGQGYATEIDLDSSGIDGFVIGDVSSVTQYSGVRNLRILGRDTVAGDAYNTDTAITFINHRRGIIDGVDIRNGDNHIALVAQGVGNYISSNYINNCRLINFKDTGISVETVAGGTSTTPWANSTFANNIYATSSYSTATVVSFNRGSQITTGEVAHHQFINCYLENNDAAGMILTMIGSRGNNFQGVIFDGIQTSNQITLDSNSSINVFVPCYLNTSVTDSGSDNLFLDTYSTYMTGLNAPVANDGIAIKSSTIKGILTTAGDIPVAVSPIAHYPLNENAANKNVDDTTGLQATATTFRNTDAMHTTGKISGSLYFNGNADYVDIPHNANQLLTNGFTITAWIAPDSAGENNVGKIVDKSTGTTGQNGYSLGLTSTGQLRLQVNAGTAANSSAGEIVYDSSWQFITTTVNPAAYVTHYVNGSRAGPSVTTGALVGITTGNNLRIGQRSGGDDRTFEGDIDDVRIFDRVLTLDEILTIYNEGSGTEDEIPVVRALPIGTTGQVLTVDTTITEGMKWVTP